MTERDGTTGVEVALIDEMPRTTVPAGEASR
jgi:hypothetical protein